MKKRAKAMLIAASLSVMPPPPAVASSPPLPDSEQAAVKALAAWDSLGGAAAIDCSAMSESRSGPGWQWVSSSKTLIISNLSLSAEDSIFGALGILFPELYERERYGILLPGGSTLVLTGKNEIYGFQIGIGCKGDLSIVSSPLRLPQDLDRLGSSSTASLTVLGGPAISCSGNLSIAEGAQLKAGSGTGNLSAVEHYGGQRALALEIKNQIILDVSAGVISIGNGGVTITKGGARTQFSFSGEYILTGSTNVAGYGVTVEEGAVATLFLQDLKIDHSKNRYCCPIDIRPKARVTMILKGKNSVAGGTNCAGIRVGRGAVLTISEKSSGTLDAAGGAYAAGIGGSYRDSVGDIVIAGGTVTGAGSSGSAGIGTSKGGSGGSITLTGGTVSAAGGFGAAAVGAGSESKGTRVTVSGGAVLAKGGYGAPAVGAGENCSDVSVTISGGEITAKGGSGCGAFGAGEGSSRVEIGISGGDINAAGGYGAPALGSTPDRSDGEADTQDGGADGETGDEGSAPASVSVSGGNLRLAPGLSCGDSLGKGVSVSGGSISEGEYFEDIPKPAPPEDEELFEVGGLENFTLEADELSKKRAAEEEARAKAAAAAEAAAKLSDVADEDWFAEPVRAMVKAAYMKPLEEGRFDPNGLATRAVFVYALYCISGGSVEDLAYVERYGDVDYSGEYGEAILWGTANGILLGYGDGNFGPEDKLTREQACAIFNRCAKAAGIKLGTPTTSEFFKDDGDIGDWAYDAVYICKKAELVVGYEDGSFRPGGEISRAELAAMLLRYLQNFVQG